MLMDGLEEGRRVGVEVERLGDEEAERLGDAEVKRRLGSVKLESREEKVSATLSGMRRRLNIHIRCA